MSTELLEVQPSHLQFTFEVKKQTSCVIRLENRTDQYVAFKVKTTSPKKYSVRPNVGVVKPNATCDFTVTMLAQPAAPPNLQCKDKFLIQSTVVPEGTEEEDVTKNTFSHDGGKFIEEKRLKVFLVSPLYSPILAPVNEELNQDSAKETLLRKDRPLSGVENTPPAPKVSQFDPVTLFAYAADTIGCWIGIVRVVGKLLGMNSFCFILKVEMMVAVNVEEFDAEKKLVKLSTSKDAQELKTFDLTNGLAAAEEGQCRHSGNSKEKEAGKDPLDIHLGEISESFKFKLNLMGTKLEEDGQEPETPHFSGEMGADDGRQPKHTLDVKETEARREISGLKFYEYSESIKSKLNLMDAKLKEAEMSIKLLREEKIMATREKEMLKCEFEALKKQKNQRKIQVGFPLLYVLMVALISLAVGYYSHAL